MRFIYKIKVNSILVFLLVFTIVWINEDSFIFSVNSNYNYIIAKYIIYCFLIVVLVSLNISGYNNSIYVLGLIILLICLTSIFNFDFTGGYIYQIITIVLSFLLVKEIRFIVFSEIFCKVMYFLSIVSLAVYLIVLALPSILLHFPEMTNIAGTKCYNLYLSVIFKGDGYSLSRNTSIFREPGVFMIYLNIALIFSLFLNKTMNRKYILVYLIAIISTMSTAGVILGGLIIALSIFFDQKKHKKIDKYVIIVLFLMSLTYFATNEEIYKQVFDKLNSNSGSYNSTMARIVSLLVPVVIFYHNPLWGAGLSSFSSEFTKYSISNYGISFLSGGTATSTITNKFATYGLFFGVIFVIAIFLFSIKISARRGYLFSTLLFLVMVALFTNEDMRYSLLFNMLVFYGICHYNEKRIQE